MDTNTAPEVLTLDLPHIRLTALAWGPVDGRLVVCLHGYPDSAWCWRHLGPFLARKGYRVVAPFTRGYAPSEVPGDHDYHIGALMYDAIAVHDHLRGQNAVIIGHDWGGVTANAIAAYPLSPFAKAISLAVPPFAATRLLSGGLWRRAPIRLRQFRLSWYAWLNQIPFLPEFVLRPMIAKLWRDWTVQYDAAADIANAHAAVPTWAHRQAMVSYYRALARPRGCQPAYLTLHHYAREVPITPMLCVHGERDRAMQKELAENVLTILPAGSQAHVVPDAGHFLLVEQPDVVNRLIADYLD